jgi:hypothetical protein
MNLETTGSLKEQDVIVGLLSLRAHNGEKAPYHRLQAEGGTNVAQWLTGSLFRQPSGPFHG